MLNKIKEKTNQNIISIIAAIFQISRD